MGQTTCDEMLQRKNKLRNKLNINWKLTLCTFTWKNNEKNHHKKIWSKKKKWIQVTVKTTLFFSLLLLSPIKPFSWWLAFGVKWRRRKLSCFCIWVLKLDNLIWCIFIVFIFWNLTIYNIFSVEFPGLFV